MGKITETSDFIENFTKRYLKELSHWGFKNPQIDIDNNLNKLTICLDSMSNHIKLSFRCFTDNIDSVTNQNAFHDIIRFLKDLNILSLNNNIESQLLLYLNNKGFCDTHVVHAAECKVWALTYKQSKKYSLIINLKPKKSHPEESIGEETIRYSNKLIKKLSDQLSFYKHTHFNIDIGQYLQSVKVSLHTINEAYSINCRCHSGDLTIKENEDAIYEIISFADNLIKKDNFDLQLIHHLKEKSFYKIHTVKNTEEKIHIIAYKADYKYSIIIEIKCAPNFKTTEDSALDIEKKSPTINFDSMEGYQFELFCADLLQKNNFKDITVTRGSGDQGIDIIAYRDDIKYGIQCKCYSSTVGNKAVQEVFAGKTFYQCHVGIVLTNNYFSPSAIDLA